MGSTDTLMQSAGLAVAKLALATAPHAQKIWIACGPGNNGGDGLEAAVHLLKWGKKPWVSWLGDPDSASEDTAAAYQRVRHAGIAIQPEPCADFDLVIDALLGIGAQLREPQDQMAEWIKTINSAGVPVLSVDVPSGLHADTGQTTALHVQASHTLSLLTLKPGLFTASGRDVAGTVWLDTLGVRSDQLIQCESDAVLMSKPAKPVRSHTSHKGTYGDVAVVGGATGMTGAAMLAASAALHQGAGRVFVALLDDSGLTFNAQQPELMFRTMEHLDFSALTVVCGCGGGSSIHKVMDKLLLTSAQLVIDADAINALARDPSLQDMLLERSKRHAVTVITPHPLEAARLLSLTAIQVQNDRLSAAHELVRRFACTVVVKGSGTVIASPGQCPALNPSGNGRLATAGTGDVLAGMVGANLATGLTAFDAACQAVYAHGDRADTWPANMSLTASQLVQHLG